MCYSIVILGWLLSKIDKKEKILERRLLLNDEKNIVLWVSEVSEKLIISKNISSAC